eukprot:TRINITY_DN37205_c0_g1_i1.p1 TRINITY_DN37205_c0_g1~~TRINITY_DN37205_c0_g1_i1.p1  ORF type:complete len:421 (+),score=89.67 TRINITY_DN37205_c0_g1_i1:26-1264(+)
MRAAWAAKTIAEIGNEPKPRSGKKRTATHVEQQRFQLVNGRVLHAIAQRQELENERQNRVFDPKVRTIGIDKQAIENQIQERKALLQLEADREAWMDRQQVQQDKHLCYLQQEEDKIRRQQEQDLVHFRRRFQKKEMASSWDLNDPNALKKDLPARIGADDPRCSTASLQKFEGEDQDYNNRLRLQQQQVRDWYSQQMDEKRLLGHLQQTEDRLWENRSEELMRKAHEVQLLQQAQKKQAAHTTAAFNQSIAEEKRRQKLAEKQYEAELNNQELMNQLNDPMLNEWDRALSNGKRDPSKGLTREQILAIHNERAQQYEARRQARILEAEERQIAASREKHENDMAAVLQRQIDTESKSLKTQLADHNNVHLRNTRHATLQKKRLYAQEVGEQYFEPYCPPDYPTEFVPKSTR